MPCLNSHRVRLAACAAFAALCSAPAVAQDYYAGSTIDLIIGSGPAGGYDIYGRALARHIGRHIPGKPNVVVKNMPGAGSARAAGFLAKIAPKDGTVIAGIMPGAIMGPLLEEKAETLFDPTKVQYLGTANNGTRVCVSWATSEHQELRRRARQGTSVRRGVAERVDPRLCLHAAPGRRRHLQGRLRLRRHHPDRPGDGARRGRRVLRLGLVERQVAEAPTGCATRRST